MAASENWSDPNRCPFCGEVLSSPGSGFVAHVEESPDCETRFEEWRGRIADDMRAGWAG